MDASSFPFIVMAIAFGLLIFALCLSGVRRFNQRRALATGDASMSMDGVDVLRLEDGKIVEMWLFSADQAAEDAFWGK